MKLPSVISPMKTAAAGLAVAVVASFGVGHVSAANPGFVQLEASVECTNSEGGGFQTITVTLTNHYEFGPVYLPYRDGIDVEGLTTGDAFWDTYLRGVGSDTIYQGETATGVVIADWSSEGVIVLSVVDDETRDVYSLEVNLTPCDAVETTTTIATSTTVAASTTTSVAVEAPSTSTTVAVAPIALPSTGAHAGTAALAALFLGMGGVLLLLVRRRTIKS